MKRRLLTILLVLLFLTGLVLLLYPTVSNYLNSQNASRVILDYTRQVEELDHEVYDRLREEARAYNRTLPDNKLRFAPTEEELAEYAALLDVTGSGVMGYLEISKLGVSLPIYHGTDEAVLQIALGHIEGSSLPVGGAGTHSVISGHRGLPSARLLTDLDQMAEGDLFSLRVLDETLTYEVDQILTVLPDEMEALEILEGEDLCTLVTCTPYGVNSHRLLVRGHRVPTPEPAGAPEPAPFQEESLPAGVWALLGGVLAALLAAAAAGVTLRKKWKRAKRLRGR